jgi:FtsZ-binding cell division protein ZapB
MDGENKSFTFPSCPGKMEVPTAKEKEALDAMMVIKMRVRDLKERLGALRNSGVDRNAGEISLIEEKLVRFKSDWNRWEEKRRDAARERMVALGHEEAD